MYDWLLYAHLLGVGLLLAGLGAHTVSVERLRRSETTRELAALMSTSELGTKLVLIGGPLLIAAGLAMAIRSWSLTDGLRPRSRLSLDREYLGRSSITG